MKTNSKFIATLAFLVIFISSSTQAQDTKFQQFVAQTLLERNVAGVSIARMENGDVVEQFALTNPNVDSEQITPDGIFQVGSISKPVAAWAVMTLVRDGKVELDAPITRYVKK